MASYISNQSDTRAFRVALNLLFSVYRNTAIPGKYLHGTKTVSNEPSLLVYFVNRLYDYKNPDEIRVEWNDQNIIPTEINGKKNDLRVGKPWDWFKSPNK